MAIPAPALRPAPTSPAFHRVIRVVFYLFLLLLLAASIAAIWFYAVARSSLPQLDGAIRVPGLHQPVSVIRDAHGVPHLRASDLEDLFFAQGYVTSQDRLWQMDALRRYAAGDLSEVLGDSFLPHDRKQRILQLRWAAAQAAEKIPPAEMPFYQAYARGVNAFMEAHRDSLPIEFRILRYQPRPWTVDDSILIGTYMNQLLNTGFDVELAREKITSLLTPQLAADLYPNRSWRDHPPTAVPQSLESPDPAPSDSSSSRSAPPAHVPPPGAPHQPARVGLQIASALLDSPHPGAPHDPARADSLLSLANLLGFSSAPEGNCPDCSPGSNNWVIAGARTLSGKPLLANDMHLPQSVPGIWYEAHLES